MALQDLLEVLRGTSSPSVARPVSVPRPGAGRRRSSTASTLALRRRCRRPDLDPAHDAAGARRSPRAPSSSPRARPARPAPPARRAAGRWRSPCPRMGLQGGGCPSVKPSVSLRGSPPATTPPMTAAAGELLWTPSDGAGRACTNSTRYHAVAGARPAGCVSPTTRRSGAGRSTISRGSGPRSSSSATFASTSPPRAGARQPRRCRGGVVPRRPAELRRAHLPRTATRTRSRSATPPSCGRRWASGPGGELRAETARDRGRAAGAGRRPGRPRGRLHAEHPGDRGGVAGLRVDRRGVVLGRAGVRGPQRDRPLLADRAVGAAGDRRLPLRRAGLRSPGAVQEIAARAAGARAGGAARVPRRARAGRTASSARPASSSSSRSRSTIRCGSSTAPARPGCPSRSSTARAGS